jgi:hypothetical protein
VEAATAATMETAASTAVEPAPAAHPLGHCGSCHHKRCRKRQRSYYFQICHFDSPKLDLDQTAGGFHRSSIAEKFTVV